MSAGDITGGCQCGAVRYAAAELGRASVCHCRMCQRASGNVYAALVVARDVAFAREPSRFRSSSIAERGFCAACGTPLFITDDGADEIELMIGTLDDPERAAPAHQTGIESRLSWADGIPGLPAWRTGERGDPSTENGIVSHQHDPARNAGREDP